MWLYATSRECGDTECLSHYHKSEWSVGRHDILQKVNYETFYSLRKDESLLNN